MYINELLDGIWDAATPADKEEIKVWAEGLIHLLCGEKLEFTSMERLIEFVRDEFNIILPSRELH